MSGFLSPSSLTKAPLLLALLASAALAQNPRRLQKMDDSVHRAERQDDWRSAASAQAIRKMARPGRQLSLRAPNSEERASRRRKPGLVPVGVRRELPQDALTRGEWSVSPEGKRVWRLALQSEGAEALRVRFTGFHVGGGKVWLFGTETDGTAATAGPYTGDGTFGDGEFWTDILPGDSLIVAYEPETDGAGSDAVPFKPVAVSHRLRPTALKAAPSQRLAAGEETATPLAAAASCAVDVTCYPEYSEPASAVALMIFESDGDSYECSGALISSASRPALPFFLTANHCISTPEEARSLITLFNYQTPTCNGRPPSLSGLPRVTGAFYLAGEGMDLGDFSLLQLSGFPHIDVKVLGWASGEIAPNEQVVGISHPVGDFKRIAIGERTRDLTIRFTDGDRMPANKGYQVTWFQGVTQSGSSGSPLLANIDGKQFVVGTLSAGPDVDEDNSAQVCRTRNLIGSYGRFSAAFPYLESFLTSTSGVGAATTRQGSLTANPNPITVAAGRTTGRTTLAWQATGVTRVQIRIDSPTGPAMTGFESPTGSATTGDWVGNGTVFYLQDASDGNSSGSAKTIASVTARIASSGSTTGSRSGTLKATPNPISAPGRTTLAWQAVGVSQVQIRVGSPSGPPMTGFEAPNGSATTGDWVTSGMVFYLQDASSGNSSGSSRTLATVRVDVGTAR